MSFNYYSTFEDMPNSGITSFRDSKDSASEFSKSVTETPIPVFVRSPYSKRTGNAFEEETRVVSGRESLSRSGEGADRVYSEKAVLSGVEASSIYFSREFISVELRRAVHLLDEGRGYITSALEYLHEGDAKNSDERVMDFKELLSELFCLRTISESFGSVILAIQNAIANRQGVALTKDELVAVDEILMALLREPAMSFDRAVEHIMRFEDAGFAVESEVLSGFLDLVEALGKEYAPTDA